MFSWLHSQRPWNVSPTAGSSFVLLCASSSGLPQNENELARREFDDSLSSIQVASLVGVFLDAASSQRMSCSLHWQRAGGRVLLPQWTSPSRMTSTHSKSTLHIVGNVDLGTSLLSYVWTCNQFRLQLCVANDLDPIVARED